MHNRVRALTVAQKFDMMGDDSIISSSHHILPYGSEEISH